MKKEKSCGTIVIKDNKVLIIKHNKGHYGFPKGHMEKGENEIETAIRETKEETNIDVIVDENKRYEVNYITSDNIDKTVVFFLAIPKNSNIIPQENEISEVLWIGIDKATDYLQYQNIINLWNNIIIKDIYNIEIK